MVHFLLDRIINAHLKKIGSCWRPALVKVCNRPRFHCMFMWWSPVIFFFAYMSTNQNLQTRYKPHSPYQITHNIFAGTNTVSYPLPFYMFFLFNYILCSSTAKIIFFILCIFNSISTEKKKRNLEKTDLSWQGHSVQWHRPALRKLQADTNGSPGCVDSSFGVVQQSPWSEFCPTTS